MRKYSIPLFLVVLLIACGKENGQRPAAKEESPRLDVPIPAFSADSAYHYVRQQVAFGPRIPETEAHAKTAEYLIDRLTSFGGQVTTQKFEAVSWQNQSLSLTNIIASFHPEKSRRILLAAHWDTRPVADKDPNQPTATFDGANDGASGVGVLMEIARLIGAKDGIEPPVGVDIIFFDGEDWGEPEGKHVPLPANLESWWCLGSQYWAKNKHKPGYSAYYGILLDMVGAKNSRFFREGLSLQYAPTIVEKIWNTAAQLGYGHYFVKQNQGEITDDHKFVTEIGKIPMVNIVNHDPALHNFGSFHHTTADNLSLIDKETLKAVGVTVLTVLYQESPAAGLAKK